MSRVFAFLGITAALLFMTGCGSTFSYLVPKAAIVKAVNGQFPTVRSQGVLTLQITNPVLDFEGSKNRLGIAADVTVRVSLPKVPQVSSALSGLTSKVVPSGTPKTEVKGYMVLDGVLDYRPDTGTFVFSDVKVRKFDLQGLPRTELDSAAALATGTAVGALGGLELYKLDSTDWRQRLAKGVLKSIQVTNDGVLVKFGL
jgi:hypothetical protein